MVCFGEFPDKMSGMLQIKNGSRKNCEDLLFHGIVSFCNDECPSSVFAFIQPDMTRRKDRLEKRGRNVLMIFPVSSGRYGPFLWVSIVWFITGENAAVPG